MKHSPMHGHNNKAATTAERAEQALDTIGYQLGFLAGKASQRFEHAVSTARASAQPQTPNTGEETHNESPSLLPSEEAKQHAFVRAEEIVQIAEQRLGQWSALLSYQSQRLVARMREDLEDVWAEAQHLRNTKQRP
jgi:hypothetical protein